MRQRESFDMMMKKEKKSHTFCFLLTLLLLFFSLFVSFCFGSLGFFEAGRVSPASFSFVLGVGELFLAHYPLVVSADWRSADGPNVTAGSRRPPTRKTGAELTGDAFVGVLLLLVSAVLLHGVFGDGLHLNAGSVGQHAQILEQALPGRQVCRE